MALSPLILPAVDRIRSPYTGWTRAHWETLADHLLDAVVPYATPGFAQLRLPGRESRSGLVSDGLEGYARTFLLAAFRIAGAQAAVPAPLIERYADGLAAGTDPNHPYAWPSLADCAQQLVEAASIALALHETRPWLFDQLDPAVQQRVVDWLAGFVGRRTFQSNWVLFQVVVEQFLANVGGPYDPAEIDGNLAKLEDWYVGDGWYSDGAGQNFDYYAGWAMHLYPLLWARMAGDGEPTVVERRDRYRSRLRRFLDQYQHFFAADGAPLHQGRSLCYRFASGAPLWLGALADATDLPPGRIRRIASATLRHFVERGVPDERGLLSLGWYGHYLPCTQLYSGPASPYWASKGFLGLLLPADHPVWTDPEAAAPIDGADQHVALPAPGWLLHATRHDGVVRVVNHGSDRARHGPSPDGEDPHYARLAYASHTAPETGEAARVRSVDNHLAVIAPDGTPSRRHRIERIGVADRFAASAYVDELPTGPVRVATASVVRGAWELRIHHVTAPVGHGVREGGYALADTVPPMAETGTGWVRVSRPDGLASTVIGLFGYDSTGVARAVDANAYGPCSAVPYLVAPDHPGGATAYVSLLTLSGDSVHPAAIRESTVVAVAPLPSGGVEVAVTLPDGEVIQVATGVGARYRRQPVDGAPAVEWADRGAVGGDPGPSE